MSFDLAGFLSSAGLFLLPVSDCPCFLGPFGFAGAFVDIAAIVLLALSLSSVELPSSTDVALFPADIFSFEIAFVCRGNLLRCALAFRTQSRVPDCEVAETFEVVESFLVLVGGVVRYRFA